MEREEEKEEREEEGKRRENEMQQHRRRIYGATRGGVRTTTEGRRLGNTTLRPPNRLPSPDSRGLCRPLKTKNKKAPMAPRGHVETALAGPQQPAVRRGDTNASGPTPGAPPEPEKGKEWNRL